MDDFTRVVEQAGAQRPGRPLVVLGHSLGSFVVQTYLLDHSDRVAAAVLSGSAALDELAVVLDPTVGFDLAMMNAASALVKDRYVLAEDQAAIVARAGQHWDLLTKKAGTPTQ